MGRKDRVTKKRRKRRSTRHGTDDSVLAPYIDGPMKLRRTYKGETYRAGVRRNGWVYYDGYLYRSPAGPAHEICGRPVNGWYFWRYERAPGDWMALKTLRK